MPEARCSSKEKAGVAEMPSLRVAWIFPQSGMSQPLGCRLASETRSKPPMVPELLQCHHGGASPDPLLAIDRLHPNSPFPGTWLSSSRMPSVLEQQRIISWRPLVLARRADDRRADRKRKACSSIDVGALAGAEAEDGAGRRDCCSNAAPSVPADGSADRDPSAAARAVIGRPHCPSRASARETATVSVEFARRWKFDAVRKLRYAVDFHHLPLRR